MSQTKNSTKVSIKELKQSANKSKVQINENTRNTKIEHTMRSKGETLENTGGCWAETQREHKRELQNNKTKPSDKDKREYKDYIHTHANEGMRSRWSEAGEGQVMERNGKTL